MRSGNVHLDVGHISGDGNYGRYWSRSAYSNKDNVYGLFFNDAGAHPSHIYAARVYGISLRCLQE